jgi:hypothetical protein
MAPRTAKRWLLACAEPAADVMVAAGAASAPVAAVGTKAHPAGLLKGSLDYQTRFDKPVAGEDTRLVVKIGIKELLDEKGKNLMWYGSLQEFGTRFIQGQHWLGRAFESCKDKMLSVFATEALAMLADMEDRGK